MAEWGRSQSSWNVLTECGGAACDKSNLLSPTTTGNLACTARRRTIAVRSAARAWANSSLSPIAATKTRDCLLQDPGLLVQAFPGGGVSAPRTDPGAMGTRLCFPHPAQGLIAGGNDRTGTEEHERGGMISARAAPWPQRGFPGLGVALLLPARARIDPFGYPLKPRRLEGIALVRVAGLGANIEPVHALFGTAVGE